MGNTETSVDLNSFAAQITEGLKGKPDTILRHGAYLLNAFTTDLYTDPAQACREYVSNSADARATEVRISCAPPDYNTLAIVDNGKGMTREELLEALDIMVSKKQASFDPSYPLIGRFGVGMYAGTLLCDVIHIETKVAGSSNAYGVSLPVGKWLEYSRRPDLALELKDVTHFTIWEENVSNEETSKSYTSVVLDNLKPQYQDMMHKDEGASFIKELSRIIPIGFPLDLEFQAASLNDPVPKNWKLQEFIEPILSGERFGQSLHCQYNSIRAYFNGNEIYRPYPIGEIVSTVHHEEKAFTVYENGKEITVGVGWAIARGPREKRSGNIEKFGTYDDFSLRGVQVRLFNVGVYRHAETYAKLKVKTQSQPTGNWWGEIYLFDKDLRLSLTRTDFLENQNWIELREQIQVWLKQLLRNLEAARKRERERAKLEGALPGFSESLETYIPTVEIDTDTTKDILTDEITKIDLREPTDERTEEETGNQDIQPDISWIEELEERFSLNQREIDLLRIIEKYVLQHSTRDTLSRRTIPEIIAVLERYQNGSGE